jgi:hypothetical protein
MSKIWNDHEKRLRVIENSFLQMNEQLKIHTKIGWAIMLLLFGAVIKFVFT